MIGSLFSGIGGLELGLERGGLGRVRWQCEIDPYCRAVLAKHWPDVLRFEDVRDVDASAPKVEVICGGFPCQPHSAAGRRKGTRDKRWLWPQFARVVAALRPRWVVVENVPHLRASGLRNVLADLARLGFDAEWTRVSAADVGAPHWRQRLFIVAHPHEIGLRAQPGWFGRACWSAVQTVVADARPKRTPRTNAARERPEEERSRQEQPRRPRAAHGDAPPIGILGAVADLAPQEAFFFADAGADADEEGQPQQGGTVDPLRGWHRDGAWWGPAPSALRRMVDGVPRRMDRASDAARIGALGNAVVPYVAEVIGRAIRSVDVDYRQPPLL